jgi:hypothetical protein
MNAPSNSSTPDGSTDTTVFPVMSITLMSIGVATVLLNIFVIVIILTYTRMRSNANVINCSMAVTDLMVGFVTFTVGMVKWNDWFTVKGLLCQVYYTIDAWSAMTSLAHVLMVNGERYLAIVFPLKYKQMTSQRNIFFLLAFAWIITLAQALGYTLAIKFNDKCLLEEVLTPALAFGLLVSSSALPFLTVIVLYVHIVIVVVRKLRFMANSTNLDQAALARSQRKMFGMVSAILVAWIVCWSPLMCSLHGISFALTFNIPMDMDQFVTVFYYAESMAYGNSLLNPMLYFLTSPDFRKAGRLLIKCKVSGAERSSSMSTVTQDTRM